MRQLICILLTALCLSACSTLSRVNWDYNHLANAGGKALTAASLSDEQIAELCRQAVALTDSKTPLAEARYQQRLAKLMKGVTEIEAEGKPFDPNWHQAIMSEEAEDTESGIVLQVFQKGYKLKDRLLRAAMVKISA